MSIRWKTPVYAQGEVVEMTPLDFLSKVPSPCDEKHTALEDLNREGCWSEGSVSYISQRIERGEELEPPMLDYTRMFRGFPTHEGRHTAFVMYRRGVEKVPVLVFGKEETLATRRWRLRAEAEKLVREIREEKAKHG